MYCFSKNDSAASLAKEVQSLEESEKILLFSLLCTQVMMGIIPPEKKTANAEKHNIFNIQTAI